jgi:hypothetical protein
MNEEESTAFETFLLLLRDLIQVWLSPAVPEVG